MVLDRYGNIIICEYGNKRIQIFSNEGTLLLPPLKSLCSRPGDHGAPLLVTVHPVSCSNSRGRLSFRGSSILTHVPSFLSPMFFFASLRSSCMGALMILIPALPRTTLLSWLLRSSHFFFGPHSCYPCRERTSLVLIC